MNLAGLLKTGEAQRRPFAFLRGTLPAERRATAAFWQDRLPAGTSILRLSLGPLDRARPYFPLLDIIRERFLELAEPEAAGLLETLPCHHRHRRIIRDWLTTGQAEREDDIFRPKGEFEFERSRLFETLRWLLERLWPEPGAAIVIEHFENAGRHLAKFFLWMLENGEYHGPFFICLIDSGSILGSLWPPEFRDRFFRRLEEEDVISHSALRVETEALEEATPRPPDQLLRDILLSRSFLAWEEAGGFTGIKTLSRNDAIKAESVLGHIHMMSGDVKTAILHLQAAKDFARQEESQVQLARIHAALAICQYLNADIPGTDRHLLLAFKIRGETGDEELGIYLDYVRCWIQGSYNANLANFPAIQALEKRLLERGALDLVLGLRSTLWYYDSLVGIYGWEDALRVAKESLAGAQGLDNLHQVSMLHHMLGYLHQLKGLGEAALAHFDECIRLRRQLGDHFELARAHNGAGYLCFTMGRVQAALAHFGDSFEILEAQNNYTETSITLFNIAITFFYAGAFADALDVLQRLIAVLDSLRQVDLPFHRRRQLLALAGCAAYLDGRQSICLEYWSLAKNLPDDPWIGPAYPLLESFVLRMLRDQAGADAALERALVMAAGERQLLVLILLERGYRALVAGRADDSFNKAAVLCESWGLVDMELILSHLRDGRQWKDFKAAHKLDARVRLLSMSLTSTAHQEAANLSILKKVNEINFLKGFQDSITRDLDEKSLYRSAILMLKASYPLDSIVFLSDRETAQVLASSPVRKKAKPEWAWAGFFEKPEDSGLRVRVIKGKTLAAYAFSYAAGGSLWAILTVQADSPALDEEELRVLGLAFRHLDLTLDLRRAKEELQDAYTRDPLTGAMTRREFLSRLNEERFRHLRYTAEKASGFSLLSIDLDNFKYYNDSFGHPVGDLMLRAAVRLFVACVRDLDYVGRMGGDEFAIILPYTDAESSALVSQRILDKLARAKGFTAELSRELGTELVIPPQRRLGCSIGIAVFSTQRPQEIEELIAAADRALYEAKNAGKSCYRVSY